MAEKKAGKKINKLVVIFSLALFFLAFILGFFYLPKSADILGVRGVLKSMENLSINWRFASKVSSSLTTVMSGGTKRVASSGIYKKIIIAAVDGPTIQYFNSYPLDRIVWADMLTNFNQKDYVPDVVLFDIIFSDTKSKPASDKLFVKALEKYSGAVGEDIKLYNIPGVELDDKTYPEDFSEKQQKLFISEGKDYNSPEVQALKRFELNINKPIKNVRTFTKIKTMLPELAKSLDFAGTVNIDSEDNRDVLFRKKPLLSKVYYYYMESGKIRFKSVYYPSVVLATAARILKTDLNQIEVGDGYITFKNATYLDKVDDFKIPVDEAYRLSINYKATSDAGYIRSIPIRDIFRAGLPKNAVILVGVTAQGTAENNWPSPLGIMFSVDHLGYALGTIINRDFITVVPPWTNIIYVVVLTLLIGLLVSRGIRATIVAFVIAIAIPFGVGFGLIQFNIEILTMVPFITAIIVLISSEIFILLTEEKEKRYIKSTFSKYINPDLVNILIQNPDMIQLGGQDVDATILFSDIRGFTTLSEGMTPIELISFLNLYLSRMTDIVMETQGTLDKYIGDAVVAFWGTPLQLPNHALNGCRAAVKMIRELKKFNDEMSAKGKKTINIGVGLNSGTITVGNIGSDKKKNYTAIGDSTQLAEDLQDDNKVYGTNIIISEFTYEKVKESVLVRELDMIYIKGQEKPVRIYELLDITAADGPKS